MADYAIVITTQDIQAVEMEAETSNDSSNQSLEIMGPSLATEKSEMVSLTRLSIPIVVWE